MVIVLSLGMVSGCKKAMDAIDKDAQIGKEEKTKSLQEYLTAAPKPVNPPVVYAQATQPNGVVGQPGTPVKTPVAGQPNQPQPMGVVQQPMPQPAQGGIPSVMPSGGSGGAVQAVRGAVRRTASANDLANLRIYIESASLASGNMPTRDQILADIARDLPKVVGAVKDGTMIITGISQREGVWAYEEATLSKGGMVLTNNGVERMTPQELQAKLQQQR